MFFIFYLLYKYINIKIPDNFEFYNKTATNVFFLLEQCGLGIYYEAFNKMFNPKNPILTVF